MYTTKKDAEFYTFEDIALSKVLGLTKKDLYISENEIKDLMQKVSKSFGIVCPKFKYTRSDSGYCYYRPLTNTIHFSKLFGMTTLITLHELCHSIHHSDKNYDNDIHGASYTRIWMDVMSRMFEVDVREFEKIADARNITYTKTVSDCVKGYIPKY